jgi:hypothetical protein
MTLRTQLALAILVTLGIFALGNYNDAIARLRCSMELSMASPFYGACVALRKATRPWGIPQ